MDRPDKPDAPPAPPLPDLATGRSLGRSSAASTARVSDFPAPPTDVLPPPRQTLPFGGAPPEITQELSLATAQPLRAGIARAEQASLEAMEEPRTFSGRASLTQMPSLGRFGRYDLLGRLAYGGMAEIFLARDAADAGNRAGRFVVVKRVLPHVAEDHHFVEMFVDEARLAMHLQHPNICHVYAFGEEQGSFFIAMEWIDGMPLSKLIRRARDRGGVPIPHALKIVAQVAEALDHAHRACDAMGEPLGIVHRDVSPQNVMVAYDGPVKLLDFGIAKAASHSTRTEAGVVKGKFAYMAPQQCLGEPIDARADVFALGLCLYEILAGRNPFKRQTEFDTMRALVYEAAPPIADVLEGREARPEIIAAITDVIERAIAKKPEERFQSASEMQIAVERVLGRMGEVVTAPRIGELMHRVFDAEIKAGPQLDTRPSAAPPRSSSTSGDHVAPSITPPPGATQRIETQHDDGRASSVLPPRRSPLGLVAAAAALFLCAVIGGVGVWIAYTMGTLRAQSEVATVPAPLPVVAAAPAATLGSIYVDSTPSGARVELGDRGDLGTTPLDLAGLPPGPVHVRLQLEGYAAWERSIDVRAGERAHVLATLAPEPVADARPRTRREEGARREDGPRREATPPGAISINTRPWSKVYVGSRLLGTTPIGGVEIASGSVRLRFVDRDGAEHVRTITVPAGGHAREFFDLQAESDRAAP